MRARVMQLCILGALASSWRSWRSLERKRDADEPAHSMQEAELEDT
jgi:hypothetical protein